MAEYIDRAKTLNAIKGSVSEVFNIASNAGRMYQKITEIVKSVPATDVAPVVRCRYCKHNDGKKQICTLTGVYFLEDDFCSYGEKTDN